jgi:hypothetical protein
MICPVLKFLLSNGEEAMKERKKYLQETKKMRFKEVHEKWRSWRTELDVFRSSRRNPIEFSSGSKK